MKTLLLQFMETYRDDEIHPIVAENNDWANHIVPAMTELLEILFLTPPEKTYPAGRMFRMALEIVYCMGYKKALERAATQQQWRTK